MDRMIICEKRSIKYECRSEKCCGKSFFSTGLNNDHDYNFVNRIFYLLPDLIDELEGARNPLYHNRWRIK